MLHCTKSSIWGRRNNVDRVSAQFCDGDSCVNYQNSIFRLSTQFDLRRPLCPFNLGFRSGNFMDYVSKWILPAASTCQSGNSTLDHVQGQDLIIGLWNLHMPVLGKFWCLTLYFPSRSNKICCLLVLSSPYSRLWNPVFGGKTGWVKLNREAASRAGACCDFPASPAVAVCTRQKLGDRRKSHIQLTNQHQNRLLTREEQREKGKFLVLIYVNLNSLIILVCQQYAAPKSRKITFQNLNHTTSQIRKRMCS